jgi:hypothetical protein
MAEAAALDRLYSASTLLVGVNAKLVKEGVDEFAEVHGPDAPAAGCRVFIRARARFAPRHRVRGKGRRDARDRAARFDRRYLRVYQGGQARASAASFWSQSEPCTAPGAEAALAREGI